MKQLAGKKGKRKEEDWIEDLPPMYLERRKQRKRKKLLRGLLRAAVFVAVLAAVWFWNGFAVDIRLAGDSEVTLEYGEDYTDPGAQARFSGNLLQRTPLEVAVDVNGVVDTAHLGTYTLTYTARHKLDLRILKLTFTDTATRTVHVVDTQPPLLQLITKPDHSTPPGQAYEEEGFTAVDNYDGDITHLVERVEKEGTVLYKVTDSSGNANEILRQIRYSDLVTPELTLLGDAHVRIPQWGSYTEPGFSAVDNVDGDITGRVTVSGSVNTDVVGTYLLEYSVADSYNNTVTATRTVTVEKVTPNGKVIYLTFDDGPSAHTQRLLDILNKYNVKATFFVVKTGYLHLLSGMAAAGHTVAIHSASHQYARVYSSEDAFFTDLREMQSIIRNYTGKTVTLLRFPGGSSNTISRNYSNGIMTRLTTRIKQMGYRYFDWNVDSQDAGNATSAADVYNNVVNGIGNRNVSVVLQHDTEGFSVEAVDSIIRWGLSKGYTFLPLNAGSPACEHKVAN